MHPVEQKRRERNLSIQELAKLAGVARATISRIENRHTLSMQRATAELIAEALGGTVDELFPKMKFISLGRKPGLRSRLTPCSQNPEELST